MKHINILLIVAFLLSFGACKPQSDPADTQAATPHDSLPDTEELPVIVQDQPSRPQPSTPVTRKNTPTNTSRKTTATGKNTPAPETLYVETEGAQGRVWGHVTMRGDRGTGTIHDWDENTLTVSVTRHGDELFAIDQNSRQYVFKLKQK